MRVVDDAEVKAVLERFDRSSPDTLLSSLASEIARLDRVFNSLAGRLAAIEALQAAADRVIAAEEDLQANALPEHFVVDATFSLSEESGLYPLEYTVKGQPFRWTTSQFSFSFFIRRDLPMAFSMRVLRFCLPGEQRLRCFADGEEIRIDARREQQGFRVGGELPPRSDNGASVLIFVCPTTSPAEIGGGEDTRKLGAAFQSLEVGTPERISMADGPVAARSERAARRPTENEIAAPPSTAGVPVVPRPVRPASSAGARLAGNGSTLHEPEAPGWIESRRPGPADSTETSAPADDLGNGKGSSNQDAGGPEPTLTALAADGERPPHGNGSNAAA